MVVKDENSAAQCASPLNVVGTAKCATFAAIIAVLSSCGDATDPRPDAAARGGGGGTTSTGGGAGSTATGGGAGTNGTGGASTGGSGGNGGSAGGGTGGGVGGRDAGDGGKGGLGGAGGAGAGAGGQAGSRGPTDSGTIVDAKGGDADASTPGDSGSDAVVRFAAMGDTGKGTPGQLTVARALKQKCDADGCDFVMLLGDNIYDSGVTGVDDPQWQEKFEIPYQAINVPFYAVLGNHDYGGLGLGFEFAKGPFEVAYSNRSSKWKMPATHYTFQKGNVGFVGLDTNSILWANIDHGAQSTWYAGAVAQLASTWKIAVGHHPYLSNGTHGNAGSYTDLTGILFPQQLGIEMKSFFETHVCGTVDLYISGHDHSRQWLRSPCGMELIVAGTGAEGTALASRNPSLWQSEGLGFLYVVIRGKELRGQFINERGSVDYERILTKP
jgi:tartrate-resistant acid phosphatase type 5